LEEKMMMILLISSDILTFTALIFIIFLCMIDAVVNDDIDIKKDDKDGTGTKKKPL
jgi:hypothetical protein